MEAYTIYSDHQLKILSQRYQNYGIISDNIINKFIQDNNHLECIVWTVENDDKNISKNPIEVGPLRKVGTCSIPILSLLEANDENKIKERRQRYYNFMLTLTLIKQHLITQTKIFSTHSGPPFLIQVIDGNLCQCYYQDGKVTQMDTTTLTPLQ